MSTHAHDGRYAPSPTGELHLGNLRTALIAWLCARSVGARFWLRIDDLDPDRSRSEHEHAQIADLQALGIDWDGEPVRQSARLDRYAEALRDLRAAELTYPCFCSRAEIRAAASAPHGFNGAYPGTCAHMTAAKAQFRIDAGEQHCLRVRASGARIAYEDALQGTVAAHVDDFVVRRADGVPAYNLATTLDDADMQIGEVVRGADLATNSTRQIWLGDALSVPVPRFAHVPLVLGPDGSRLAKRHGAAGVETLRAEGIPASAIVRLLAGTIGIAHRDEPITHAADLLLRFDRGRLPREDLIIDPHRIKSLLEQPL